jgi:hypothetical protein
MKRKIRMGMVGGGREATIGVNHKMAHPRWTWSGLQCVAFEADQLGGDNNGISSLKELIYVA